MKEFVHFLTNNWLLASIFIIALIAFIANELRLKNNPLNLSPQAVIDLINHKNAVIVDLRQDKSYSDGHIINAINISADLIDKKLNSLQKYKSQPIVLVCAAGNSYSKPQTLLQQSGFQVYQLEGGLQAWKQAGLPLTKKS